MVLTVVAIVAFLAHVAVWVGMPTRQSLKPAGQSLKPAGRSPVVDMATEASPSYEVA